MLLTLASGIPISETSRPIPIGPPAPIRKEKPKLLVLPNTDDAVRMAWANLLTIPLRDRHFIRYIYNQRGAIEAKDGDNEGMKSTALTFGYLSRAGGATSRSVPLFNGILCRVDLRHYIRNNRDLRDWLLLWEELAFDPSFSRLITKDSLDFKLLVDTDFPIRKQRSFNYKEGRWETIETRVSRNEVDVIRINSRAIDAEIYTRLQQETGSIAPVVEHLYFKHRVRRTIKGEKVYKVVFGGLYYEFAGIRKAKDVFGKDTKVTDLDLLLFDLGIGSIKDGKSIETTEQVFDRLQSSDNGVIIFVSKITKKPRDVWVFHIPKGRPSDGESVFYITGDVDTSAIDISDRVFFNLLKNKVKAREAIFTRSNGFIGFALFNGEGVLQDVVPPNVATDHESIPNGYTKELEGAYGCLVCHSTEGKDGWQPLPRSSKFFDNKLDVIGDAKGGKIIKLFDTETINRINTRYTGNLDKNIGRIRDDLAEHTLRLTGPWKASPDQTDVCKLAAQQIKKEAIDYVYSEMNAKRFLADLGLQTPNNKEARKLMGLLLPADPRAAIAGFVLEDVRIAALKDGEELTRTDAALMRDFAAARLNRNPLWHELRKPKVKK